MSFRVLVDLSELKIKSFNFNYVWVNIAPSELKCIKDLKSVLLRKFNFEREDIDLFVRQGFLLDGETINVLREDDVVRIQYHEESRSNLNSSQAKCDNEDASVPSAKRLKRNNDMESTIEDKLHLEFKAKKKKKKINKSDLSIESSINHVHKKLNDSNRAPKINEKLNNSNTARVINPEKVYKNLSPEINQNIPVNSECLKNNSRNELFETVAESSKIDVIGSNCKKKKRKRHRKRKNVPLIDISSLECNQNEVIPICAVEQSTTSDISSYIRKNVRVTSPNSCQDKHIKETAAVISKNGTYSNGQSVTTENLFSSVNDKYDSLPTVSTPAVFNTFNYPNSPLSTLRNESSNVNSVSKTFPNIKNESFENCSNNNVTDIKQKNSIKAVHKNGITGKLNYSELPSLNHIPTVGSLIAYKILELNEYYSPEVSNYKEGIIKSIDPHTDEMEIELLEIEIKPGRTGKFENLQEDEVPPCEVKKSERLTWSCLIEPKLISH